jgi:maltose/moltooligosaccharide transporter
MNPKPRLSFWQVWNMCFGFLGIQFGFALQNANVSRIFQTLGANVDEIPLLWIAAPLTGLLVQPVIGYFSDRTWTGLGRRRPYFLAGAVLASLALFAFPNVPALWVAAGMLWILDASINVGMEPFRAFVGDQLPPPQRPTGYAMQSFFIGVGSVVASLLPWMLEKAGVGNTAPEGQVPDTVRYAFYAGGVVLLGAIAWTVSSTREYSPAELAAFDDAEPEHALAPRGDGGSPRQWSLQAIVALVAGVAGWFAVARYGLDKQLYVLAGGIAAYGALLLLSGYTRNDGMLANIMRDLHGMPVAMRRLALVQFFSWFALFAMWIYTTPAVTSVHFGSSDTTSAAYNEGANWVGVLFAAYNGFAALAAIAIPRMVAKLGLRASHLVNLVFGGLGLLSIVLFRDPHWLLLSMLGVGFAWASILSLPYALLSDSVPAEKMGVYMGIFNFFIVIPQIVAVSTLPLFLKYVFGGQTAPVVAIGGCICMFLAGMLVLRVPEPRPAPGN